MQTRMITSNITVANQPNEVDLEQLKREGYVGIVNVRMAGEPEQPLDPDAEGERVRALGMDYLHVGVGAGPLSAPGVEAFQQFLDRHADDKVLVHCRKGGRASAMVLLHQALTQGWSPADAPAKGQQMGLNVEGELRTKVVNYLHDHQNRAR